MEDLLKNLKNSNEQFSEEYTNLMKDYYHKISNQQKSGQNVGLNQPDDEGGVIISPTPYCCIKTMDNSNQKIFINILHHEKIDAPVEEHILEIDNQLGVRLPMSLSEKYEDFDAKSKCVY